MNRFPVRQMTLCAFFAALTAVCAWTGVPLGNTVFTLQTLAVFLSLGLLGGRWGTVSILIYLLLGVTGVPVFSGFRGGIGHLLSPTGGFLWGFLCTGVCYMAVEKYGKIPAMLLGQLACYACGAAWYSFHTGGGTGLVILQTVVPYLIPDATKMILVWRLTEKLKKRIKGHA